MSIYCTQSVVLIEQSACLGLGERAMDSPVNQRKPVLFVVWPYEMGGV